MKARVIILPQSRVAVRFIWDDACKEPYGKLSINITCDDDGFHLNSTQLGHFNLLCYRSHFILINLRLSPRSAQSLGLGTDVIESVICRLAVDVLGGAHISQSAVPSGCAVPIFFSRIIPLWNSVFNSRASSAGSSLPKSSWDLLRHWLPWNCTVRVHLQCFFFFVCFFFSFCLFHGLLSFH